MPRKTDKEPDIKSIFFLVVLFTFVICVGLYIYLIFGPIQNYQQQIYSSPFPAINPADQYIGQSSRLTAPSIKPNEKGVKIPILMYHYISVSPWKTDKIRIGLSTPPYIFEKQMELLFQNGYTTITLDDLYNVFAGRFTLPPKPVILTFDDGYVDFYQNAFPVLEKYHMLGINFVITGFVGRFGYLTWPQIEEMNKSGNVVFGPHTVHHFALTTVKPEVAKTEISQSKLVLEDHLGQTVNWFAYPYGDYNKNVVDLVRNAGFIGAVNTLPGLTQYESRLFYLTRYRAGTRMGEEFLKLIE
jgi:peptidoglycan/xylan/chitin deacetylase (PgdA/CDA1 family)